MIETADREESANFMDGNGSNSLIHGVQARIKAEVSRTATMRIQAYERAVRMLPLVEKARRELEAEFHKKFYTKVVGDRAIADRLNEYCKEEGGACHKPSSSASWSGKQIRENLMGAPERIIKCAVLECRTRMTELALSADFTQPLDAVTELENEYLEYIAQALELEHRLNGNATRSPPALL